LKIRIPVAEPEFGETELRYVTDCVTSGWISSLGPYVNRFETLLAHFCGVKHAIAVANGTVALHLGLVAARIGKGDEVIVPDMTFVATGNVVHHAGATPVLVDVDAATWNISPRAIEAAITRRTKAIIPVHLYGYPCDMEAIGAIAKRHKLLVIEDAAEALGAELNGRPAGSFGDIASFSFYANKTLTTGEGGLCTTNDDRLAARMRFLRDHAMSPKRRYYHPEIGYNYRLTALQAAFGTAQAERLPDLIEKKQRIAAMYREQLAGIPGLTLPPQRPEARSSYWMFSVLIGRAFGRSRDELAIELRARGIETRPFFMPLHKMPPYKTPRRFPVATRLGREGLSLPSATRLTAAQVQEVADAIRDLSAVSRSRRRAS